MIRYAWVVRPKPSVIREIAGLYQAAGWWEKRDDLARIRGMVAGSHCFLAAWDGAAAVGMGRALSDRTNDGYIQDVFVRPELRGRGVGAALVRRLARRLRADGLGWIGLIAADGAWPFYARLGFRRMERHDPMRYG